MAAYLIKSVETYRLPTETAVEQFLNKLKEDPIFEVIKYTSTKKDIKERNEIVESFYRVEVTKVFNEEKFPDSEIEVIYEKE
ncbi:MAG: hypothetical protein [Caudoviricetes sp.]|nr:MAG: hypothetical protein [Caudoviricetes sp.]